MIPYYVVLALIHLLVLGPLVLIIIRRAFRAHRATPDNYNTEHGLVLGIGFGIMLIAVLATSLGQAIGADHILRFGSGLLTAELVLMFLYVALRHPESSSAGTERDRPVGKDRAGSRSALRVQKIIDLPAAEDKDR